MTTLTDLVEASGAGGFTMGYLQDFSLYRPMLKPDPYNPDALIETSETEQLTISGYLYTGGSSEQTQQPRTQIVSTASLIIPNPSANIRRGDHIEDGTGRRWRVTGFPATDVNPFTGWQPTLVAALEEVQG